MPRRFLRNGAPKPVKGDNDQSRRGDKQNYRYPDEFMPVFIFPGDANAHHGKKNKSQPDQYD